MQVQYPLKNIIKYGARYLDKNTGKLQKYIDKVVGLDKDPIPHYDYDVYLMSLPRYISHDKHTDKALLKTTLTDTIPNVGKCLYGYEAKTKELGHKLPRNKFKIGVCWKASPLPGGITKKLERDTALRLMMRLGEIPGVQLYNLLSGIDEDIREKDAIALAKSQIINVVPNNAVDLIELDNNFDKSDSHVGASMMDKRGDAIELLTVNGAFVDTAALMENLNLIISVDTAIPNLAGAMARPVWILLPNESDWRWFEYPRADSPWMPTARLFWSDYKEEDLASIPGILERQAKKWGTVFESVERELIKEVEKWKACGN